MSPVPGHHMYFGVGHLVEGAGCMADLQGLVGASTECTAVLGAMC